MSRRYVVVTPVRDEEKYLPSTIASMTAQRERPTTWVIVDDGSTDRTPLIADAAAREHAWIRVHTMPPRSQRILGAGVVQAFKAGLATVDLDGIDFISKLDADLELDPLYYSMLLDRMDRDPRLGIASGQAWVRDEHGSESYERGAEEMSIGQAKLYRRETLEDIGGLAETLAWDGIDSHEARSRGWRSRAFADPELRVMTLRPEGASDRSVLRGRRRRGRGQWILGTDPLFMLASTLLRVRDEPAVLGSLHTLYGYAEAALTKVPRHGSASYGTQVRRFQREALVLGKKSATRRFEQRTAARWQGAAQKQIAVLVSQHPTLSHTFIDREIYQLRELGWDVHPFSLRQGDLVHADATETTTIRRLPRSRMLQHLGRAAAHPWALLVTARESIRPAGKGARPIGLAYLAQAVLLLGELRRNDLDHVHVHFANNAAEVARLASHLADRDTVGRPVSFSLSIHGLSMHGATSDVETDTFPDENADRWGLLRDKVVRAAFVRAVDPASAERVAAVTRRGDVEVVPVGIDPERFDQLRPDRRPDEPFTVGFVGRVAPEKQVPLLVEAFARMQHMPRALRVAGSGPCVAESRAMAEKLGVDVTWTGSIPQDELPGFLAGLDVLAMSSSHEGTPIVLMEAMASGLPVVAPRVGGIPEVIEHGVSGLLVAPNDVEALAGALDRLATDPELRRSLGTAGRARVRVKFSSAQLATGLSDLLSRATTADRASVETTASVAPQEST
ncbi:glycosyltransferase [Georgenia sp. Marseille-Q6866]